MSTKLTLTIEEGLINKAKIYAKNKGRSLSDLVESYLRLVTKEKSLDSDIEFTPTVKSLIGSFNAPENFDYKKILSEELIKKHG